jgi:hypothetical protein
MTKPEVYISRVESPKGLRDYVHLLPPEKGLIAESIIGMLPAHKSKSPVISQESFTRNGVFVDLMHAIIKREVLKLSAYQKEAARIGNGPCYVIDRRAAEDTTIQQEDTFGVFEVQSQQIITETYEPNPTHRLLSKRGFFQLEEELYTILMHELTAMAGTKEESILSKDSQPGT